MILNDFAVKVLAVCFGSVQRRRRMMVLVVMMIVMYAISYVCASSHADPKRDSTVLCSIK